MADPKDSVLDKAESLARRALERVGSRVDSQLASANEQTLKPNIIGDLASRIEHAVESSLEEDQHGVRRIAPDQFKVLFTYEETSTLTPQYIEAVTKELTASVVEYVNNRRYSTYRPIEVEVGRDLFAKSLTVKASFSSHTDKPGRTDQTGPKTGGAISKFIRFDGAAARSYSVELKPDGAPAYIGRTAGNAVRIDDPSVSRLHCSLSLRGSGSIIIADLGSINGTWVNGQPLGPDEARVLSSGDIVGVGDFKLTVSEIA